MGERVSLLVAFVAGVASFLSPCFIPLLPAYLASVVGDTVVGDTAEGAGSGRSGKVAVISTLQFVAGFSLVFVLLGLSAGAVGAILLSYRLIIRKISGALIVLMGLQIAGIISFAGALRERRLEVGAGGPLRSVLLGATFGFAWTPCIGPILASILLLASQQATVWMGGLLLLSYSAGMAVPFIIVSVFVEAILGVIRKVAGISRWVRIAAGLGLVILGLAVFVGWF